MPEPQSPGLAQLDKARGPACHSLDQSYLPLPPEADGYDGFLPGTPADPSLHALLAPGAQGAAAGEAEEWANRPRRKRNRLTLSCTHCRERKIRCSRTVPCDQCIKRGEARSCHIVPYKHRAPEQVPDAVPEQQAAEAAEADEAAAGPEQADAPMMADYAYPNPHPAESGGSGGGPENPAPLVVREGYHPSHAHPAPPYATSHDHNHHPGHLHPHPHQAPWDHRVSPPSHDLSLHPAGPAHAPPPQQAMDPLYSSSLEERASWGPSQDPISHHTHAHGPHPPYPLASMHPDHAPPPAASHWDQQPGGPWNAPPAHSSELQQWDSIHQAPEPLYSGGHPTALAQGHLYSDSAPSQPHNHVHARAHTHAPAHAHVHAHAEADVESHAYLPHHSVMDHHEPIHGQGPWGSSATHPAPAPPPNPPPPPSTHSVGLASSSADQWATRLPTSSELAATVLPPSQIAGPHQHQGPPSSESVLPETPSELSSAKMRISELEEQLSLLRAQVQHQQHQQHQQPQEVQADENVPSLTSLLARTGLSEYKAAARGRPRKLRPRRMAQGEKATDADNAAIVLEGLALGGAQHTRPDRANRSLGGMAVHRVTDDAQAPSSSSAQSGAEDTQSGRQKHTATECSDKSCPVCLEHATALAEISVCAALPSIDILDPRRIDAFGPLTGRPPPVPNSKPASSDPSSSDSSMREIDSHPPTARGSLESRSPLSDTTSAPEAEPGSSDSDQPRRSTRVYGAYAESCKLAVKNRGLFRLKQGPDTILGWGMGWAFGAAEAAGEFKGITNSGPFICPGAPERESVLRGIIRTLPPKQITLQLIDVYRTRVYYLTGHIVHIPSLIREVERFYDLGTPEKQARIVNHLDPGWLALLLMVLVLGMQFYPNPGQVPRHYTNINFLFDGRTVHMWYSAFKTVLLLSFYMASKSTMVLQAILLAELYSAESDDQQAALLQLAVRTAVGMGLHRLGDRHRLPQPGEPSGTIILREIYCRIWWTLVWRDWCNSETTGMYTIQRNTFNTPRPGNYNDADLCQEQVPPPHGDEVHTEMSYVLAEFALADVVRETSDLLNKRDMEGPHDGSTRRPTVQDTAHLDKRYRLLLTSLPSFFSPDEARAQTDIGSDISVQRWLLHQTVFTKLLRLHRVNLSSDAEGRGACVRLARYILAMQRRLRTASSHTIVERLWFILLQSFNAAVVLLFDLLTAPPSEGERTQTLNDVQEAVGALTSVRNTSPYVARTLAILHAMISAEETQWTSTHSRTNDSSNPLKRRRNVQTNVLMLAMRIKEAIEKDDFNTVEVNDKAQEQSGNKEPERGAGQTQDREREKQTTTDQEECGRRQETDYDRCAQGGQGATVGPCHHSGRQAHMQMQTQGPAQTTATTDENDDDGPGSSPQGCWRSHTNRADQDQEAANAVSAPQHSQPAIAPPSAGTAVSREREMESRPQGMSGGGAAAEAKAAGFPPAAEFPYLLGPPPGEGPLDFNSIAPSGGLFSPGPGIIVDPPPYGAIAVSPSGHFDLPSFVASYQNELANTREAADCDLSLVHQGGGGGGGEGEDSSGFSQGLSSSSPGSLPSEVDLPGYNAGRSLSSGGEGGDYPPPAHHNEHDPHQEGAGGVQRGVAGHVSQGASCYPAQGHVTTGLESSTLSATGPVGAPAAPPAPPVYSTDWSEYGVSQPPGAFPSMSSGLQASPRATRASLGGMDAMGKGLPPPAPPGMASGEPGSLVEASSSMGVPPTKGPLGGGGGGGPTTTTDGGGRVAAAATAAGGGPADHVPGLDSFFEWVLGQDGLSPSGISGLGPDPTISNSTTHGCVDLFPAVRTPEGACQEQNLLPAVPLHGAHPTSTLCGTNGHGDGDVGGDRGVGGDERFWGRSSLLDQGGGGGAPEAAPEGAGAKGLLSPLPSSVAMGGVGVSAGVGIGVGVGVGTGAVGEEVGVYDAPPPPPPAPGPPAVLAPMGPSTGHHRPRAGVTAMTNAGCGPMLHGDQPGGEGVPLPNGFDSWFSTSIESFLQG